MLDWVNRPLSCYCVFLTVLSTQGLRLQWENSVRPKRDTYFLNHIYTSIQSKRIKVGVHWDLQNCLKLITPKQHIDVGALSMPCLTITLLPTSVSRCSFTCLIFVPINWTGKCFPHAVHVHSGQ